MRRPTSKAKKMKKKKPMMKRATKKVAKKVMKKVTKRLIKKMKPKMAKVKITGRIVHYYDRIGVAIVELVGPLRLGEMVRIKRGDKEWMQSVTSLQIDHTPVAEARRGAVVGMKVTQEVPEGAVVMPA